MSGSERCSQALDWSTTRTMSGAGQALEGVRVLELASGVAGPFCARLFADYGAEVLKVEDPGSGDPTRSWGPFPEDRSDPEQSGTFFFLNTSKQSVALDPSSTDDRKALLALVDEADVLVTSHSTAEMEAWELGPEAIAERNPQLVTISLTPFGLTGPMAAWKGYDLNAYHFSACGTRYCGLPDEAPLEHGTFSADFFAGYVVTPNG